MAALEKAVFAAGCFWGVEEFFRKLEGVTDTMVGYAGGQTQNPTYKEVCTDQTGHAEVVEVTFDPDKISFQNLLDHFFDIHDPTQLNCQGPDFGSQYRSSVFFADDAQRNAAEATIKSLTGTGFLGRKIVTALEPLTKVWPAEEYHQKYIQKKGGDCGCAV